MGDILSLIIRLLTFGIFIAAFTFVPYKIWRLSFWNNIKNGFLKIIAKIVVIVVFLVIEFFILSLILASIWSFEQSSGNCYGFSCPLKL